MIFDVDIPSQDKAVLDGFPRCSKGRIPSLNKAQLDATGQETAFQSNAFECSSTFSSSGYVCCASEEAVSFCQLAQHCLDISRTSKAFRFSG